MATRRELIDQLNRENEELEKDDLSVSSVAKEFVTEGIPSLIKGTVAAPIELAKYYGNLIASPVIGIEPANKQIQAFNTAVSDYAYDRWQNPSHALPEAGVVAGTLLGGLVGLPNVGAGAGALVGTGVRNLVEGKPWSAKDVSEVMIAPLGALPFAAVGAAARVATGTARQTTKASTIFTSHRFTPEQIALADDLIDEARAVTLAKREQAHYLDPQRVAQGPLKNTGELLVDDGPRTLKGIRRTPQDTTRGNVVLPPNTGVTLGGIIESEPGPVRIDRIDRSPLSDMPDEPRATPEELKAARRAFLDRQAEDAETRRKASPYDILKAQLTGVPSGRVGKRLLAKQKQAIAEAEAKGSYGIVDTGFRKLAVDDTDLPRSPFKSEAIPYTEPPKKPGKVTLLSEAEALMPAIDTLGVGLKKQNLTRLQRPAFDGKGMGVKREVFRSRFDEEPTVKSEADTLAEQLTGGAQKPTREQKQMQRQQLAREKVAAHVAEQESMLRAERTIKDDPYLTDLFEDERNLARQSVLAPDHLQPTKNPFVRELSKAGMMASVFNPHVTLNRLGPHGYWTSQNMQAANDLYVTGVHKFRERAHATMDKYNVQNHDLKSHGLLMVLEDHPALHDMLREKGPSAVREWEQATGQRVNVAPKDYKRLHELGQYRDELREQAMAPMWLFGMKRNPDPDVLANYNVRYASPTYTARRAFSEIEGDIQTITGAYDSLSELDKKAEHGRLLLSQRSALTRKLEIARKAADESEKSRAAAVRTLYTGDSKPGEVINSAYKDKHTDMTFGTGLRDSMDDYIAGFLKKAVYDPVMKQATDVINSAPVDASTKRWMTAYALDQVGVRRKVQLTRMNDYLKRIPGIGKYVKEDTFENAYNTAGQYHATMALGLNPKFYPVNATQLLTNGYGLVGGDGLAVGINKAITNWPAAYKEAVSNGAVQSGLESMWTEVGTTKRGHVITRFTKEALQKGTAGIAAEEAFLRTVMYHSGKFIAGKEGLIGRESVRRALDINRMANFGYSPAERATFGGTPVGSALGRYKSFGLNQLSSLKHLLKSDPKAAAEKLAMILALSGTAGVPMWGVVQDQLAQHFGYNVPNLTPFDEVTGTNLSTSFSPWPSTPSEDPFSAESIGGPLLGPVAGGVEALVAGDEKAGARAIWGVVGAAPKRIVQGLAEHAREGLTRSPSGKPLIQRQPADVLKTALGFKHGPKAEMYKRSREVMRAHETGDMEGLRQALDKAKEAGVIRPGKMLSTAKRLKKAEERKPTLLESLLGQ